MDMDLKDFMEFVQTTARSVGAEISSPWFYLQFGLILTAAGIAYAAEAAIRSRVDLTSLAMRWPLPLRHFVRVMVASASTAVFTLLVIVSRVAMYHATWPSRSYLLMVAAKLGFAWLVIRLVTSVLRNAFIVKLVSITAWFVAALSIVGQLDATVDLLDSFAIVLGGLRLTPLLALKAGALLLIALWLTNIASNFAESRINSTTDLTPSVQVLLVKIIPGIILLADKSVKPGDLVTIGDNTGRISAMKTRYISVAAGDGREFLVPNEDLVTQKVVNWTYTDKNTLVKIAFGTNYDADPKLVCKLAAETAEAHPRAQKGKPPTCLLTEFAEAGMKFSLTFWIADPDGMDKVKSDVMLELWDAFKREGIRVPYPVREIRIRGGALPVETAVEVPN
ncbi:mechanosensitive ion channel [Bradyrhizobium sp. CNPSo 4010]|uniref:Mechanosensitive ion channel n=1 Tax=Bradyrhizobium agreste TaxID=2751811 RepID=A0ABS0PNU5_9BRAD|nr:mechanosensitive ion channel domain-containing protein [Bradyrhizobium agreste]MBH5398864.1 mechanosensitive ion channel [Bradyrhizobium agreste]